MRRAHRLILAALAAMLAVAPATASAQSGQPSPLRVHPLPPELTPASDAAAPSVALTARGGRPFWLLPAAGMVAGAVIYPMLVDEECQDCTIYIPEPVTGGIIGLLGGITLEVLLIIAEAGVDSAPVLDSHVRPTREPSASQPGTRMLP